jgi:hypothetical protein
MASPFLSGRRKAPPERGIFFLYSISSVYHVERGKSAKIIWIVSGLLSPQVTFDKWWKLDKKTGSREWGVEKLGAGSRELGAGTPEISFSPWPKEPLTPGSSLIGAQAQLPGG